MHKNPENVTRRGLTPFTKFQLPKSLNRNRLLILAVVALCLAAGVFFHFYSNDTRDRIGGYVPRLLPRKKPSSDFGREPVDRLEKLVGNKISRNNSIRMSDEFEALARVDPLGALKFLEGLSEEVLDTDFFYKGLAIICKNNDGMLLDWLGKIRNNGNFSILRDGCANAIAGNPDSLMKLYKIGGEEGGAKAIWVHSSLDKMGKAKLLNLIENTQWKDSAQKERILIDFAYFTGSQMTTAEISNFISLFNSPERASKAMSAMLNQSMEDKKDIVGILVSVNPNLAFSAITGNSFQDPQGLVENNPSMILDLMSKIPITLGNKAAMKDLLARVSSVNPKIAADYATDLPSSGFKNEMIQEVVSVWPMNTSHDQMMTFMNSLDGAERDSALKGLSSNIRLTDAEVKSMITMIPPSETSVFLGEVITSRVALHPEETASFYTQNLQSMSEEVRGRAAASIASNLASANPTEAVKWFGQLGSENEQVSAIDGIVSGWCKSDAVAASRWLMEISNENVRKAGAISMIHQIQDSDPESALQWKRLAGLKDDGGRSR